MHKINLKQIMLTIIYFRVRERRLEGRSSSARRVLQTWPRGWITGSPSPGTSSEWAGGSKLSPKLLVDIKFFNKDYLLLSSFVQPTKLARWWTLQTQLTSSKLSFMAPRRMRRIPSIFVTVITTLFNFCFRALCNGKWDHEHEEHEHGGHAKDVYWHFQKKNI